LKFHPNTLQTKTKRNTLWKYHTLT
jgi:hypothetical protein